MGLLSQRLGTGMTLGGDLSDEWVQPSEGCPGLSLPGGHREWGGGGPSSVGKDSCGELSWAHSEACLVVLALKCTGTSVSH